MSNLNKRRQKVERLATLSIQDRNPLKYFQALTIIKAIDDRMKSYEQTRLTHLENLRK